jgi:hypothetical protein
MRVRLAAIVLGSVFAAIAFATSAPASSAKTVWLCFPGHRPNPCSLGLSTTVYTPKLKRIRVSHPRPVRQPAIDCFYVYPTVSSQKAGNANLNIDPEERSVARTQAARYSQYCRVYAPMYRQVTLAGLGLGAPPSSRASPAVALASLQSAFRDYLERYNRGRGFVLIGHSQGSFMLRQLIAHQIDKRPAVRRRLISAILLGGNVLVKRGTDIGGDFKHIPACHSPTQLGCVIAFSSFDQPVPSASLFGRPTPILGTRTAPGDVVLCTNPAALRGGAGRLDAILPSDTIGLLGAKVSPRTSWAAVPGSYRAFCSSANSAHVLQIQPVGGASKPRQALGPAWGLHLLDANIALGNLVAIVKREASAFAAIRRQEHSGR